MLETGFSERLGLFADLFLGHVALGVRFLRLLVECDDDGVAGAAWPGAVLPRLFALRADVVR